MKNMIRLIQNGILILFLVFIVSCNEDETIDQDALDQKSYNAANAIRGGQLYDKFWAAEGYTGPSDQSVIQSNIENFPDFYRCRQCHGWDQRANTGWYINRAPNTGRPAVSGNDLTFMKNETILRNMFEKVAHAGGAPVDPARTADGTNPALGGNNMPDYSKILTEAQIWDLVKFLKEGAFDTKELYDLATTGTYPTGTKSMTNLGKNGDALVGDTFYANTCASCHGADGKTLLLEGKTLGAFVRGGPHESQHKMKNGHPGSIMVGFPNTTLTDVKNLLKALNNTSKYPD